MDMQILQYIISHIYHLKYMNIHHHIYLNIKLVKHRYLYKDIIHHMDTL